MISGVNHITLSVGDVDRAFRFYVETLGARPLARWSKGAYLLAGDLWLFGPGRAEAFFFAVARVLARRIDRARWPVR
jgi:catechol 2,3-dioxygenase-like lactoylglutathione lyase family enzyme